MVLSASVCTLQGKALVSRQFVEMTRLRVEGLLAAFPKLIGLASSKQHTFVETDTVRYVYQPLENNMFLLLITTKASNIVEDLGTLRLLAKVVPDVAGGFQEHAIQEHAFDLIFAFDEVLTSGGYKEEVALNMIRTNLLMDSHEEKIQKAIRENQEMEARKRMMDQAKKIQEQKLQQTKQNLFQGVAPRRIPEPWKVLAGVGMHPPTRLVPNPLKSRCRMTPTLISTNNLLRYRNNPRC